MTSSSTLIVRSSSTLNWNLAIHNNVIHSTFSWKIIQNHRYYSDTNTSWDNESDKLKIRTKKNFTAPFLWGSTASMLEPLQEGSFLFTTKFPEIPGIHFIDLRRMKDWVDLGATHWLWTQDHWIENPAP